MQVMPYEDAKTYRFNPFDLTKVWPHGDYPLIEVGTMTLNRNPDNFFAADRAGRVRAAAHRAGHRLSARTRCCSAGSFSYADAHRYRIGANYKQLPVNRPQVEDANTYTYDGPMAYDHTGDGRSTRRTPCGRGYADDHRRGRGRLGGRRRDGARGLHAARRRRRLRPGRHAGARGLGRRSSASGSSRRSPATCSAASPATSSSAPSSTGRTSTQRQAPVSRRKSGPPT